MEIESNVWMDTKEAADYLKMSPQTLENMRLKENCGPKFYKPLQRKILYLKKDLDAWVKSGELKNE